MMFVPAAALGATFPVAVRWYVGNPENAGRAGGALYAVNTAGAAVGALVAGFVLIPAIGIAWTTRVGVAASVAAIAAVFALLQLDAGNPVGMRLECRHGWRCRIATTQRRVRRRPGMPRTPREQPRPPERRWLAATVLGLTGLASLMYEIAWTRVLSQTIGPTIYAFSATLAVLIAGVACGSAAGAWVAGRTRRPAMWLALSLAGAAIAASWACTLAGGEVPRRVAQRVTPHRFPMPSIRC